MIRILQAVNIMDRAGIETMIMNYYCHIDRNEIQFDFLTHRSTAGAYDSEIKGMGGIVYRAPRLYPTNYPAYLKYMKNLFVEHPEYQIVHSHIDTMSAFPLYAAKLNGIPVRISHSHSTKLDKDFKLPIKYLAKMAVPCFANIYCACGEQAGKFMFRNKPFKIIHNAIDLKCFQFSGQIRNSCRAMLGLNDAFVVGHVGRYCYNKNQSFLLEVFSILCRSVKNAKLLLIGKGEDETMLRMKASKLHCSEDVLFLVDRADVNKLYQAMDVFVMPSLFEGLPVAGVEAQANGLPCIMSDRISNEICITDTVSMLRLEDSAEQWAKAIENVPKDRFINCMEQLRSVGYDVFKEARDLTMWYNMLSVSHNNLS